MKKIFSVLIVAVFILALLFAIRPFAAGFINLGFLDQLINLSFLDRTDPAEAEQPEKLIRLEPAEQFSVTQGKSTQALRVSNESNISIHYKLGHAHPHLSLKPREDALAPGSYRNITVHADDLCPSGDINLMVYLLAEAGGEKYSMKAVDLFFTVIPGELKLEGENGQIIVLWNGEPAPAGVTLTYYGPFPDDEDEEGWQIWGETPELTPPVHLEPGNYTFEFKAELGEVVSAAETINVTVD